MASEPQAPGVAAQGASVRVGDTTLLRGIDLGVAPGELCAVIGVSGSGKSTLLRVLSGMGRPTGGRVTIDGVTAFDQAHLVGYVPFGEVVHRQLTVREALAYSAALRLPDAPAADRAARVESVIRDLRMEPRADARVDALSDGERRRVAVGSELVGAPRALVLDEPTTGLDPDLQRRLMLFLRGLADSGLPVILSTHSTSSLDLCDRIAVLAPGGRLSFAGTEAEVLAHFGETSMDAVYDDTHALAGVPAADPVAADLPAPDSTNPPPLHAFLPQVTTLTSRYSTRLRRQPRSLAILLGQAPIIGLAIALVLPAATGTGTGSGSGVDLAGFYTLLLAFTAVIGAIWLGLIGSCREIADEDAILNREVAIGVRLDSYVVSKCLVLLPLAAVQVVLLILPLVLLQPLDVGVGAFAAALPQLVAAGWVGVMLGLLISSLVRTGGQATAAVPLVMIPQLLFSGALISLSAMSTPMRAVSNVMPSRWALSSIGRAFDLDTLVAGNVGDVTGLEASSFDLAPPVGLGVLVGATVFLFIATTFAMSRRAFDSPAGRNAD